MNKAAADVSGGGASARGPRPGMSREEKGGCCGWRAVNKVLGSRR